MNITTEEEFLAHLNAAGGTAFPCQIALGGGSTLHQAGMTVRDYFAAQALTGWIARFGPADLNEATKRCYQIADSMLKVRGE